STCGTRSTEARARSSRTSRAPHPSRLSPGSPRATWWRRPTWISGGRGPFPRRRSPTATRPRCATSWSACATGRRRARPTRTAGSSTRSWTPAIARCARAAGSGSGTDGMGDPLRDKVLLITGSTGIAAATAQAAVAAGARVVVVSRTREHLSDLASRVQGLETVVGDLAQAGTAEAAVRRCVETHGRLDAVFNVAGISGRRGGDGPLHECTEEG